jgi:hypothetical protein
VSHTSGKLLNYNSKFEVKRGAVFVADGEGLQCIVEQCRLRRVATDILANLDRVTFLDEAEMLLRLTPRLKIGAKASLDFNCCTDDLKRYKLS